MKKTVSTRKSIEIRKNESGFTLVELLISITIFSLIIGGIVLFSVRTIESYTKSHATITALQNAQFAMEVLNKRIRVSHDIKADDSEIFFIQNATNDRYCYKFEGSVLKMGWTSDLDAEKCGDISSFYDLVGDSSGSGKISVTGGFVAVETDEDLKIRGYVRSLVTIGYNEDSESVADRETLTIQSTVSLKDF